jgi:hypothetical protein
MASKIFDKSLGPCLLLVLFLFLAWPATAGAEFMVYPAKGQSAEQQDKDKGECHQWAVKNSGVNPASVAATPAPSAPQAPKGRPRVGRRRGRRGGGSPGGVRRWQGRQGRGHRRWCRSRGRGPAQGQGGIRNQAQQQQAATQQHQQQTQAQLDKYNRAYKACLEGKGYNVQ